MAAASIPAFGDINRASRGAWAWSGGGGVGRQRGGRARQWEREINHEEKGRKKKNAARGRPHRPPPLILSPPPELLYGGRTGTFQYNQVASLETKTADGVVSRCF